MMKEKNWIDEPLFLRFRESMPIASVDLLIVNKGKLLLMLRNNEPAKDMWFTPGGRIRYGETLEQAVERKLKEETGLSAIKIERKGAMSHLWPQTHCVSNFFRIDAANDNVKMNNEHRECRWISKIPNDLHPYLKQMIRESEIF